MDPYEINAETIIFSRRHVRMYAISLRPLRLSNCGDVAGTAAPPEDGLINNEEGDRDGTIFS
jgi:hypothetical protein